jgi:hypothetical protein
LEIVEQGNLNAISAESNLYDRIVLAQLNDEDVQLIKQKLDEEDPKYSCFCKDSKDAVWFEQRLVVLAYPELIKEIFYEAHLSKFSIHPGSTKMYQDLTKNFWWSNMKVDIAKYVLEYDTCHRVKASHLKSASVLQQLTIPLLSDYINLHPLRHRSDSAPDPTSEKIRICNRIPVISTPLHIRQKNMDADVVKILSDPIRSDPLSSLTLWKWGDISMDFIEGFTPDHQKKGFYLGYSGPIDQDCSFHQVHTTYFVQDYAELYVDQIVRLHGIPKTIVSDQGTQFVAHFWE